MALSKQTASFQFVNTNFGSAAKFFKIWFWDNSGTNAGNKRQIVVEVNATKVAQGYTNEQASASGNIGVKWMLKTDNLFAFYNNNSNDLYTLKIRAVQSNNIAGSSDITVTITNSTPIANGPGGVIVPSNTQPGPGGGRNLTTLIGSNGSANPSNNNFGMTASLSGDDASSFLLANTATDGQWRLSASSTFNFTSLFGTPSNGAYPLTASLSWSVTDNGGLTNLIAQNITLTPVQVVNITGYHNADQTTACNNAQQEANTVYYASKGTGTTIPSSQQLYINKKVYTHSRLTTTLGAGFLVIENGTDNFIPYTINSSGVVTAIGDACPII